jgi:type IV pilus assembly protein PilP
MMLKHPAAIRTIIYFLCLLSLIWGCDQQAEDPSRPIVITKKIVAKKKAVVTKKLQKRDTAKKMSKPKTAAVVKQRPKPKTKIAAATTQAESKAKDKKLVGSLSPTVQKLVLLDSTNVYNPQGKLDPFEPLFQEKAVAVAKPRKKRKTRKRITPIEKLDLSQLQLVGVIRSLSGNRALVEDATGKGYVVTKGTYIGTRYGKIVEILADRIIVAEEVENVYGKVSVQKRPLIIQKPPGE